MPLTRLVQEIESHSFAIDTNVVSGTRSFYRAVAQQRIVRQLWSDIQDVRLARELVFHVSKLSRQRIDIRYENPLDTALAVYLWTLWSTHPELARVAAEAVAQAPNCFWSARLSERILQQNFTVASGIGSSASKEETKPPAERVVTPNAGEFRIVGDLAVSFLPLSEGHFFEGTATSPVSTGVSENLGPRVSPQIGMYEESVDVTVNASASGNLVRELEVSVA